MSVKNMKVVVLWTKDNKVGVEKLLNVPENKRFVGSVTPVRFQGDKKFYPAKILLISDDSKAVEAKAKEVASEIAKFQSQPVAAGSKRKRGNKKLVESTASDQDVALALGNRQPVPKHLEGMHKAHQKSKKDSKVHHTQGQMAHDNLISDVVRKNLFPPGLVSESSGVSENSSKDNGEGGDSGENDGSDSSDSDDNPRSDSKPEEVATKKSSACETSCSCKPCLMLQKYENPIYGNFLLDLVKLFDSEVKAEPDGKKYLKLKEIPSNVKQVELVAGKGILISLTDKEQLKVDYRNKPSSLVRETLYALYGRECFQQLTVTGCGTKPGTYAIPVNILKTLCTFVNRNVRSDQALKLSKITSMINKRAPEWRNSRKFVCPKTPKLVKDKDSSSISKAISTSPFKVSPLTPVKSTLSLSKIPATTTQSPMKLHVKPTVPAKSPLKSPVKSPAKSPAKSPKAPLFQESKRNDLGYQPNGQLFQQHCDDANQGSHGSYGYGSNYIYYGQFDSHYPPHVYGHAPPHYYSSQWEQTSNTSEAAAPDPYVAL